MAGRQHAQGTSATVSAQPEPSGRRSAGSAVGATQRSYAVRSIVTRFRELAVSAPGRTAVIDAYGLLTFDDLWQRAYQQVTTVPSGSPGALRPLQGRPTAELFVRALAAWLTDGVPLPVRSGAAPATIGAAIRAAGTGEHSCGPWLAHLTDRGVMVLGGAPPTSHRAAAALGVQPRGTLLLGADPGEPLTFELAVQQLLQQGTVVLAQADGVEAWRTALSMYRATVTILDATLVTQLLDQPTTLGDLARRAGGTLHRVIMPIAVPRTDAERLARTAPDAAITIVYHRPGAGTATSTVTPGANPPARFTATPGTDLRVVGPHGNTVPAGRAGLLEATSTIGGAAHLAGRPCTTTGTWHTVGDLAARTHAGEIVLHGSQAADSYTAQDGHRVTVEALVAALRRTPGVTAVDVFVVPDAQGIGRAHARITGRPGLAVGSVAAGCAAAGAPITARAIAITEPSDQ